MAALLHACWKWIETSWCSSGLSRVQRRENQSRLSRMWQIFLALGSMGNRRENTCAILVTRETLAVLCCIAHEQGHDLQTIGKATTPGGRNPAVSEKRAKAQRGFTGSDPAKVGP